MHGWDDLERLGAFDFRQARETARSIFEPLGAGDIEELGLDTVASVTYDSVVIGSAAIALAIETAENVDRLHLPIAVPSIAARLSFMKVDCTGTHIHVQRDASELQLWDVTTFAGDMAKLATVGTASVRELARDFTQSFDAVVGAFREGWSPIAHAMVETGRLHLDALVIQAQLWRLVDPSEIETRLAAFAERYDDLPLPLAPA